MSQAYLGEIRCFGFNFAPYGWALCSGQLLSITQYTALFSILGTNFGGNGTTTFGLPNLQGQVPMHWGSGPSLPTTVTGDELGTTAVTLNTQNLPLHNHTAIAVKPGSGQERSPTPGALSYLSESVAPDHAYNLSSPSIAAQFSPKAISVSNGGSQSHVNMQPYLVLNFCIALTGDFPPRT